MLRVRAQRPRQPAKADALHCITRPIRIRGTRHCGQRVAVFNFRLLAAHWKCSISRGDGISAPLTTTGPATWEEFGRLGRLQPARRLTNIRPFRVASLDLAQRLISNIFTKKKKEANISRSKKHQYSCFNLAIEIVRYNPMYFEEHHRINMASVSVTLCILMKFHHAMWIPFIKRSEA
jgi:hypothetical protein